MSGSAFSIQDVSRSVAEVMVDSAKDKFTGQVSLTMHFRDGGVGRITVQSSRDLKPGDNSPLQNPGG